MRYMKILILVACSTLYINNVSAQNPDPIGGVGGGAGSGSGATSISGLSDGTRVDVLEAAVAVNSVDISGRVIGPASATDLYIPVFDSTTGKIIKVNTANCKITDAGISCGDGTEISFNRMPELDVNGTDDVLFAGSPDQPYSVCYERLNSNPASFAAGMVWRYNGTSNSRTFPSPIGSRTCYQLTLAAIDAGDIASGTLAAARLPNPGASSLGGVQSKTCDPGYHVSEISTSGVVTCSADSGGGFVNTEYIFLEECDGGNTTTGAAGRNGLVLGAYGSGATMAYAINGAAHPGICRITTGTSGTSGLSAVNQTSATPWSMWNARDWEIEIFAAPATNTTLLADTRFRVGIISSVTATPGGAVMIRYDATLGDTTFMFQVCDSTTSGCGSAGDDTNSDVEASTITPSADTFYRFRIRKSGSTLYFRVNDETEVSIATTQMPSTATAGPVGAQLIAVDTDAVACDLDLIYAKVTGLTRY